MGCYFSENNALNKLQAIFKGLETKVMLVISSQSYKYEWKYDAVRYKLSSMGNSERELSLRLSTL